MHITAFYNKTKESFDSVVTKVDCRSACLESMSGEHGTVTGAGP